MKSKDKSILIDRLKKPAMDAMAKYRLPASVIIAIAIKNSNWGQEATAKNGNCWFNIPAGEGYEGDTVDLRVKKEAEDGSTSFDYVPHRAYKTVNEAIDDFCKVFITHRVVANGPFKFASCLNKPYAECLRELKNLSGMEQGYLDGLMALIDNYRLMDNDDEVWAELEGDRNEGISEEVIDEALQVPEECYYVRIDWKDETTQLVSTKSLESAKQIASKQRDYKVFDKDGEMVFNSWPVYDGDGCYRVRKTWYDQTDQKIVTRVYDDAVKMAEKYKGYKVFSSAGDMLCDPWEDYEEPDKNAVALVQKLVLTPGMTIELNETPVFRDPYTKGSFARFNGRFYIFDSNTYGPTERVRICNDKDKIGVPLGFCAYVEQSMVKH